MKYYIALFILSLSYPYATCKNIEKIQLHLPPYLLPLSHPYPSLKEMVISWVRK